MKVEIDPKVDFAFKGVFGREGNTDILLDLLNAILGDSLKAPLTELTVLNPFSDQQGPSRNSRFWTLRHETPKRVATTSGCNSRFIRT
jgi:hypothetical protein